MSAQPMPVPLRSLRTIMAYSPFYYVSKSLITETANDHSQGRRIPAGNLEGLVIGRLRVFLADEGAVLGAIATTEQNGAQQKKLIVRGRQISDELPTLAPDAVRSVLMMLVNRIDVKAEHIKIRLYRQRIHDLLQAQLTDSLVAAQANHNHKPDGILKLKVKARLQRVGQEMKLVVHNAEDRTVADPGLLRIVARPL